MEEIEEILQPVPNIIVTLPIFFHTSDPDNKFVIPSIHWVRPYHTDPDKKITDDGIKSQINEAAEKAVFLSKIGVVNTNELFKLRDFDTELPSGYITGGENVKIEVMLISGPIFDQRMVKDKKITVH